MILSKATIDYIFGLGLSQDQVRELLGRISEDELMFERPAPAYNPAKSARNARYYANQKRLKATESATETTECSDASKATESVLIATETTELRRQPRARIEDNPLTTEGPCSGSEDKSSSPGTLGRQATHRGSRLPADWQPSETDTAFGLGEGLTLEEIARGADEFRDYWLGVAGNRATKADWVRTFRNRLRQLADRKRERGEKLASRPANAAGGGRGASSFADIFVRRHGTSAS